MKSDANKFFENIARALHDFYISLGGPAWILMGALSGSGFLDIPGTASLGLSWRTGAALYFDVDD